MELTGARAARDAARTDEQHAARLLASTPQTRSGMLGAMTGATHSFVGRSRELEALRHALHEAAAGRGALWLVSGEPGIGKSRLLEELARMAADQDIQVFWGRCWEAGGAPAYWPWIQVLRALLERADLARVVLPSSAAREQLTELMPELAGGAGGPTPPQLQPDQARFRLMDAVTRTLRAAGQVCPLLVMLEDLHAADASSLLLLSFVAKQLPGAPIVVVGTFREGEVQRGEVAAPFDGLLRDAQRLPLGRLDRAHVAAFLTRIFDRDVEPDVVESVFRATEGNPLFVGELARYLSRAGLRPSPEGLSLPPGIRATIRARLALLSPATQQVLQLAAVIGRECRRATLFALARERAPSIDSALDEAAAAEVMAESAPGVLRFSHALLQQVMSADIDMVEREACHARIAQQLTDESASASERAHHWLAAGHAHVLRAADVAIEAAREASARHALNETAHWYGKALGAKAQASASSTERCDILLALGHAQIAAHEIAAGRASCLQAAQLAREQGDSERLARAALAYGAVYTIGEVHQPLVALLVEALTLLPQTDSALRARVMARLAAAQQPAIDPQPPMQVARDAIAMARRVGDPATLLSTIVAGCSALMDLGDPEECHALEIEQIALARQLGDATEEFRGNLRLVFSAYELGDLTTARAAIDACAQAALRLDQPHFTWRAEALFAMRATAEGDFVAAKTHMERALSAGRRAGDPNVDRTHASQWLTWLRLQGRMSEMRPAIEQLESRIASAPQMRAMVDSYIGGALAWSGDREAALARFGRIADVTGVLARDATLFEAAADLAVLSGDPALTAFLYERSRSRAGRWSTGGVFGFTWDQPVLRSLGRLALAAGRLDEARACQAQAIARLRPSGLRGLLTWALHEARELATLAGDTTAARELGGEAETLARELAITLAPSLVLQVAPAAVTVSAPVAPVPAAPPLVPVLSTIAMIQEGDHWSIRRGDRVVRLRDGRGAQMLARLLAHPDQDLHVLDLASPGGAVDGGDAGVLLDETARRQYKARIESLRAEIDEAEEHADIGRQERAQHELDAIASEVARGVGLGGRDRRAGSAVERARVNVQRRLRDAINKLAEHDPDLGRHLSWAVKTGTYCSYRPQG